MQRFGNVSGSRGRYLFSFYRQVEFGERVSLASGSSHDVLTAHIPLEQRYGFIAQTIAQEYRQDTQVYMATDIKLCWVFMVW